MATGCKTKILLFSNVVFPFVKCFLNVCCASHSVLYLRKYFRVILRPCSVGSLIRRCIIRKQRQIFDFCACWFFFIWLRNVEINTSESLRITRSCGSSPCVPHSFPIRPRPEKKCHLCPTYKYMRFLFFRDFGVHYGMCGLEPAPT